MYAIRSYYAAGIGVFRTEGGTEGIDPTMGLGEDLGLKLTADRQAGTPSKKILGKRCGALQCSGLQRRHRKHLPCPFTVGGVV